MSQPLLDNEFKFDYKFTINACIKVPMTSNFWPVHCTVHSSIVTVLYTYVLPFKSPILYF